MLFKKQEIHSLDFTGTEGMNVEGWETWCEQMQLSHLHQWLLPQLVAYYGSWTLVKNPDGTIDCLGSIKHKVFSRVGCKLPRLSSWICPTACTKMLREAFISMIWYTWPSLHDVGEFISLVPMPKRVWSTTMGNSTRKLRWWLLNLSISATNPK